MKRPLQGRMNSFSESHMMSLDSPSQLPVPREGPQMVVLGGRWESGRDPSSLGSPATSQSCLQEPLMELPSKRGEGHKRERDNRNKRPSAILISHAQGEVGTPSRISTA